MLGSLIEISPQIEWGNFFLRAKIEGRISLANSASILAINTLFDWAMVPIDRLKPILKLNKNHPHQPTHPHPHPPRGIIILCPNQLWSSSNFQDIFPIISNSNSSAFDFMSILWSNFSVTMNIFSYSFTCIFFNTTSSTTTSTQQHWVPPLLQSLHQYYHYQNFPYLTWFCAKIVINKSSFGSSTLSLSIGTSKKKLYLMFGSKKLKLYLIWFGNSKKNLKL